jgi:hypothetical protein
MVCLSRTRSNVIFCSPLRQHIPVVTLPDRRPIAGPAQQLRKSLALSQPDSRLETGHHAERLLSLARAGNSNRRPRFGATIGVSK